MEIITVKIQGENYLVNGTMLVPNIEGNRHYKMVQEWLAEGNEPEAEFTDEELEAKDQATAKVARTEALANLTVEVNGHVFDANETARTNMMAAILSADLIGKTEESWKLADNSTETITLNELKQALAMAIQAVGEIVKG